MPKVLAHSLHIGINFNDVCRSVISANGWNVEQCSNKIVETGVQFTALSPQSKIMTAFSVNYLQAGSYSDESLKILYEKQVKSVNRDKFPYLVILTSIHLSAQIKEYFQEYYLVQIIDLHFISLLSSVKPKLLDDLRSLCDIDIDTLPINETTRNSLALEKPNSSEIQTTHLRVPSLKMTSYTTTHQQKDRSNELIKLLKTIKTGNKNGASYQYQELCTDVLKYLFSDHLTGWYKQKNTTDGLHRYDLICRVLGDHELWHFIAQELNSRYVLFEFKNHSKEIGQDEVYSTGKYLYQSAKRNVCFLISRFGPKKNALIATQSIMRDQNRLIIHLCDQDLIDLLNDKKHNRDPNRKLFKIIDTILMSLPK